MFTYIALLPLLVFYVWLHKMVSIEIRFALLIYGHYSFELQHYTDWAVFDSTDVYVWL